MLTVRTVNIIDYGFEVPWRVFETLWHNTAGGFRSFVSLALAA